MLTLEGLLNLDILSEAELLNGHIATEEYIVDSISVQEPPVEGFIRENEVVLSTAIGLDKDFSLLNFIQNVHEAQATALILSFNPEGDQTVCQEIIDYITLNQFPLIKIPWEVRFSDVITAVLDIFQNLESEQEKQYINLQKELLHIYFEGASLEKAAELIANTTKRSILIQDKDRTLKGAFHFEKDAGGEEKFSEVQIEVSNYLYGYLKFSKNSSDRDDATNFSFFHFYINVPLSLWFEKEEVINTTSLNLRNDFVWQLANEPAYPKQLLSQGIQLGFDMDLIYFCVLLQIHEKIPGGSYTDNFLAIESHLISLIKDHNLRTMISLKDKTFVIFLEHQSDLEVSTLLDNMEENILAIYPDYAFTWGISEIPQEKYTFYDQYNKAKIALEQALYLKLPRLHFKESRISGIVNQMMPREELMKQALELFEPIESQPRYNEEGMDLITTITAYLKTNYNTSKTARLLNIHRQSLLYRLEKFEELTELSLDDNDELFLLQYYLRLLGKFQID